MASRARAEQASRRPLAMLAAMTPYRSAPRRSPEPLRKGLDPWLLALFFAVVMDAWQIASGFLEHRSITGELGFLGVLAVTGAIVAVVHWRGGRRPSPAGHNAP